MKALELIHQLKKKAIKFWKDYFTVEGTYTSLLPDSIYLKQLYYIRTGRHLNLSNPQTFTEKLNWLKLYDRKPEYTIMVDKLLARTYVKERLGKMGEINLVPLIGVWDQVEDIPFDELPNQFVLKCNHDNGVIICKDKSHFDIDEAKKSLVWHLNRNYYKKSREWPYKNVKRKILCEKYMNNKNYEDNIEYKIFCFNGIPKLIMVISNRFLLLKIDIYDTKWNWLDLKQGHYSRAGNIFKKPAKFDMILHTCSKLSDSIPFLRVDFNYWNNNYYFGELTFFDSAGMELFNPEEWEIKIGNWINIPQKSL